MVQQAGNGVTKSQPNKLGKLKLDEQISHRFGLDDINDAIDTVRSGEAGRCLITMSDISR